jgi:hypothetical protein
MRITSKPSPAVASLSRPLKSEKAPTLAEASGAAPRSRAGDTFERSEVMTPFGRSPRPGATPPVRSPALALAVKEASTGGAAASTSTSGLPSLAELNRPGSIAIVLPDGSRHPQNPAHFTTTEQARALVDYLRAQGVTDLPPVLEQRPVGIHYGDDPRRMLTLGNINVGLALATLTQPGGLERLMTDLRQEAGSRAWTVADGTPYAALPVDLSAAGPRGAAPSARSGAQAAPQEGIYIQLPDGSRHLQNPRHFATREQAEELVRLLRQRGVNVPELTEVRPMGIDYGNDPRRMFTLGESNVGLMLSRLAAGPHAMEGLIAELNAGARRNPFAE